MSIADQILRLQADSAAIANAITAKGVSVPAGSGYDDYAGLIGSISTDIPPAWLKDGDTHLWINIAFDEQKSQELRLRMIGEIDWGDGTTESINVTSFVTKTHTYANKGKYRIDLKPSSGTFYIGGGSSSYSIMGTLSQRFHAMAALYQAEVGSNCITTLSSYAFTRLTGLLRVRIPKNITVIGTCVFHSCVCLRSVEFEDISTITAAAANNNVFYFCYSLWEVNYPPSNCTGIGNALFYYCFNLEEIVIPQNVASIGASAFASCYSLKKLVCKPTTPPVVANVNAFSNLPAFCVIEVPQGTLAAYQSASIWSDYASRMVEASN